MKPSLLVTREVFDETLAYLAEHCEIEANQQDVAFDAATLAGRLADRNGVMCALTDRIDAALLGRCPRLKVVANIAVGYNNIDLPACTARGIMVTNTPGVLDDSTADLAWALLMAAARRLTELERRVRAGEWTGWRLKQWLGTDVHHAALGIVGMGRIGQVIAKRAAGFEMKVFYCNRKRVAPEVERRLNATHVSLAELLGQSDFVILQVPYSPETHHLIGAAQLALMKPGAILVNSTRGGVVDDAALVAALKSGAIRAAALDVFENEPKLHPGFLELDNVVLAPHVGSSTEATRRAMAMTAAQNAVAALTGKTPPNLLNPEARKA
jgi:lactate dehydrogenase-like 2-hydroxyacid dehydrogenase